MAVIGLCPTQPDSAVGDTLLLPRPEILDGQTLGIVRNGLFNSGPFFDTLIKELLEMDDYAGVIDIHKPSVSVPAGPEDWADLTAHATIAITGFGGCGSCSARSMRDAIELEQVGIPALTICHIVLEPSARAVAKIAGFPDYPVLTVGHPYVPLATWSDDEAHELGHAISQKVRAMMMGCTLEALLTGATP